MRNVCFGLKILCVHHWNSHRIMARADLWHPVIHFLEVSMVQISLQIARSPSSITHIMYLKCLLHNLCSINVCFKGCDTTSAHYFPGLCSFSAVCRSPDQDISLSVCKSAATLTASVMMMNVGQYALIPPEFQAVSANVYEPVDPLMHA